MNSLFILQLLCCTVTSMLALTLAYARLQILRRNRHYEMSRWLLVIAMSLLSIHYVVQMAGRLRATSDDMGAVANIIFYSPTVFLVSCAQLNVVGGSQRRRTFTAVGIIGYALILAAFAAGPPVAGLVGMRLTLAAMLALFVACMAYFIVATVRASLACRRMIEEQSGADIVPYDRYAWTSYLLLCVSALTLPAAILSRPLLFIVGPLTLAALFVFTMSFIGFGYNMAIVEAIGDAADTGDQIQPCADACGETAETMSQDCRERIGGALDRWCSEKGYRDTSASLQSVARYAGVSKEQLSLYLKRYLSTSFRLWLSDLRFDMAKRMLTDKPLYSNETVSTECGFSSRSHLYRVFKARTGMTPGQWKESEEGMAESAARHASSL